MCAGEKNIFFGQFAGRGGCTTVSCNTGGGNIALGQSASKDITTGNNNIAIGDRALCTNSTSGCNIGLGFYAGLFVTGVTPSLVDIREMVVRKHLPLDHIMLYWCQALRYVTCNKPVLRLDFRAL